MLKTNEPTDVFPRRHALCAAKRHVVRNQQLSSAHRQASRVIQPADEKTCQNLQNWSLLKVLLSKKTNGIANKCKTLN
jgi:hypothetical protein